MTVPLHFVKVMLFTTVTGALPTCAYIFGTRNYSITVLVFYLFSFFPEGMTHKDICCELIFMLKQQIATSENSQHFQIT